MEFSKVASDTAKEMRKVVNYILDLNISPDDKISRLIKSFNAVGQDFYDQMFSANSELFDSEAIKSLGFSNPEDQIQRLSVKIVRNYNLGRETDALVKDFYDSALGMAQKEAFDNANSLGKHPTLTRIVVGETCQWCISKAGTYTYPSGEDFARHADCDCIFRVSGYNSRNGLLTNYIKKKG